MRAPTRCRLLLLAASVTAAGCPPIDNSGGPAPDGEPLEIAIVTSSLGVTCADAEDTAVLLDDLAAVDAFVAGCTDGASTVREATAALDAAVASSYDGERELVLPLASGGCLSVLHLFEIRLDEPQDGDPVLRPWVLRGDESYEAESDCAPAETQQVIVARAADAAAGESVALTIGTYNPDLPGAPQPELYDPNK